MIAIVALVACHFFNLGNWAWFIAGALCMEHICKENAKR